MRFVPESNVHVSVRLDDVITVANINRLSDDEIIALFNAAFAVIKEKLGTLVQYSMMNNKIISERSVTTFSETSHLVSCSFYWEREYELDDEINNFNSVTMHLTNKIREDLKKLEIDKRFEWIYPDVRNVRFYKDCPEIIKVEEEN